MHGIQGLAWPDKEPLLVKKAILGRNNTQERKPQRLAMTPDILWILKMKLAKSPVRRGASLH